jgi:predicted DNA-binding transcriptional regulator AlpA
MRAASLYPVLRRDTGNFVFLRHRFWGNAMIDQDEKEEIPPMLITEKEVARLMGLSVKTLAKWRKAETGPPFIKLSNDPHSRIRYYAEGVLEWIKGNTRQVRRICGNSE